jgi:FkbM family methyltransferase
MEALVRFDNPPEGAVFLWQSYEPDLERVIEAVLAPGEIAVDVGANCGIVTLAMRAAVGPTGRVISVDPSPSACLRVQQQAALNHVDNIEVVCAALGAKQETTQYFRGRVGLGSLPRFDSELTTDARMTTKVTTVDHLVRARDIERVALLKIDTAGRSAASWKALIRRFANIALLPRASCSRPACAAKVGLRRSSEDFSTMPATHCFGLASPADGGSSHDLLRSSTSSRSNRMTFLMTRRTTSSRCTGTNGPTSRSSTASLARREGNREGS